MKGAPGVGGLHQSVVVLGGQQHELPLAAPCDLDRSFESSLEKCAIAIASKVSFPICLFSLF
jgi:hypothetical protein